MGTRCQLCKMMEKHKYWNELPSGKKHRFFKTMSSGYFQRQLEIFQLSIPKKFVQYFKGESLSGWWSLRGPNGKKWMVEMKRIKDESVLSEGWGSFVKDHSIKPGDTLIFTYTGNSSFQVSIFNSSGCEREVARFATHSGSGSNINHRSQPNDQDDDDNDDGDDDDDDASVEITDTRKSCAKRGTPSVEHQTPRSEEKGPSSSRTSSQGSGDGGELGGQVQVQVEQLTKRPRVYSSMEDLRARQQS